MRLFRFFLTALLLAGFGLTALPAAAGTLTWGNPTWANRQGTNRRIDILNRQDCLDDATASFSVQILGVSTSAVLEVWAGTNCDNIANRTGSGGTKTCVQVTEGRSAITSTTSVVIQARLQSMVMPYTSSGADAGTVESCDLEASPGLVPRSLFFVVYNTGTTMSEAMAKSWAFKYDIKAPAPPTNVTAAPGEGSLVTTFTPPTGESNLLRYRYYCSLVGAPATSNGTGGTTSTETDTETETGGATDGAAGTSGDDTDTESTDPFCVSDILVPGEPVPEGAIDCGFTGASGTRGGETSEVLENGVNYAMAVATEDDVNNIGVLSELSCGVPQEITGFYEAYRAAGGQAGGGFCSFGPAGKSGFASLIAAAVAACALLRRRR